MTKRLQALLAQIDANPKRRERVDRYKRAINTALALGRLRESQAITQRELAARMGVAQSNISRIEREDDVYLSTLRSYVENLGGRLEINAVFHNETIKIGPDSLQVRPTTFAPIGQALPKIPFNEGLRPFTEWMDGQLAQAQEDINISMSGQLIPPRAKAFADKTTVDSAKGLSLGGAVQQTITGSNRATSSPLVSTNTLVA